MAVGLSLLIAAVVGAGPRSAVQAGLLYLPVVAVIAYGIRTDGLPRRFGLANWITLGRAALVCGLFGVAGRGSVGGPGWLVLLLGLAAFLLDGLDGWVARRTGTSSAFGARFDRDVDALFVLVLGVLVVDLRNVGPWVLITGGLRYAFLACRVVWPWLAAELPPSRRRKVMFGAQVLLLLACLAPVAGPGLATALAAAALAVVSASFAVDIVWLRRLAAKRPSPGRRMRDGPLP